MFIKRNQHLRALERVRIPETRDLERGLRLDRNERVADWPVTLVTEALKNRPDCFLSTYPDGDALYQCLSNYLQVDSD